MLEQFNGVSGSIIAIWTLIGMLITGIATVVVAYESIYDSIELNTKKIKAGQSNMELKLYKSQKSIEVNQMMLLKAVVKTSEKNPCPVSDLEWDDYVTNYTTLYELKIKYGKLHKNSPWEPIERIKKGDTTCLK